MIAAPYEEPAKSRMRVAASIAIDQAGFTVVDEPVRIALPADSKIQGSLLGDLQSLDGEGKRAFYYLRPGTDTAVPKWIGNLARASHAANAGEVYIVVTDYVDELVESCKDSGAGLLRLTEDSVFEMVVDYAETAPKSLSQALEARLTEARRRVEKKVEFLNTDIEARYSQSAGIIAAMEGDAADRYREQFESEYRNVDSWGSEMSRRLDRLAGRASAAEISEVEALIDAGPPSNEGSAA
jgi:hypothetical protein